MDYTWRHLLGVFLLYRLLSLVYTWPLAPNIATHIPDVEDVASLDRDATLATWYPWWAKQALLDSDKDQLYSDWIFYPAGMEMTMQPMMILHGWMTIPFSWLRFTTANNADLTVGTLNGFAMHWWHSLNWRPRMQQQSDFGEYCHWWQLMGALGRRRRRTT